MAETREFMHREQGSRLCALAAAGGVPFRIR